MAATISFHAGDTTVQNLSGSGLGFFGSSFGASVEVGAYQDTTYITDGNGLYQGPACENVKWTHANSGICPDISPTVSTNLQYIPNRLATLNIRFSNDTAVKTQNTKLKIFDRSNVNNAASGVTTKVASIIHPDVNQAVISNSSDSEWTTCLGAGSSTILDLHASPGQSGQSPVGPLTTDTRHDWYVAISASPDSIGAKTMFGLFVETEYL